MKYAVTAPIHILYHSYPTYEIYIIMALVSTILMFAIGFLFKWDWRVVVISIISLLSCSYINIINFNNYFEGKHFLSTDEMIGQVEDHYHLKYADGDSSKILPTSIKDMQRSGGDYWVYLNDGDHVQCKTIIVKNTDRYLDAYVRCNR